jgi:hypothetical protein
MWPSRSTMQCAVLIGSRSAMAHSSSVDQPADGQNKNGF